MLPVSYALGQCVFVLLFVDRARLIARGFRVLAPSARVPPSHCSSTSPASTARGSRTPARLAFRYRTSCETGYQWGRVSELWSGIVPYGCSWARVFGGERACIDSRGHETRRVGGEGKLCSTGLSGSHVDNMPSSKRPSYSQRQAPVGAVVSRRSTSASSRGMGGRSVCDGVLL